MHVSRFHPRRLGSAAAAALGAAALLLGGLPSHGQRAVPDVAVRGLSHPFKPRATGVSTGVTVRFSLPAGFTLVGNPRVRVTDAQTKLTELLPTLLGPGRQVGQGYRDLHSENYPPGTYQVRAEIDYRDPQGRPGTMVSPPTVFTIPAP